MKKLTKFLYILSLLFIVLGLLIFGISYGFGARFENLSQYFTNSKIISYFYRNDNTELEKDALIWENPDISEKNYFFVKIEGEENPINNLQLEIDTCSVVFVKGEKLQVKALNLLNSNITCKVSKSGTFVLKDNVSFGIFNIFGRKKYSENAVLEITLPEAYNFEKINISNKIGSISITENAFSCKQLKVKNENGNITLNNIVSQSSEIYTNYGNILLSGNLFNKSKLKCDSGKIDLYIGNDFSYFVKSGLGNIIINGNSYSNSTKNISSFQKEDNIEIQCKLGSIRIISE